MSFRTSCSYQLVLIAKITPRFKRGLPSSWRGYVLAIKFLCSIARGSRVRSKLFFQSYSPLFVMSLCWTVPFLCCFCRCFVLLPSDRAAYHNGLGNLISEQQCNYAHRMNIKASWGNRTAHTPYCSATVAYCCCSISLSQGYLVSVDVRGPCILTSSYS